MDPVLVASAPATFTVATGDKTEALFAALRYRKGALDDRSVQAASEKGSCCRATCAAASSGSSSPWSDAIRILGVCYQEQGDLLVTLVFRSPCQENATGTSDSESDNRKSQTSPVG